MNKTYSVIFAKNIQFLSKYTHIKMKEIEKKCEVSPGYFARIIKTHNNIGIDKMIVCSKIFNMSIDELISEDCSKIIKKSILLEKKKSLEKEISQLDIEIKNLKIKNNDEIVIYNVKYPTAKCLM